jgi:hypothetical protein
MEGEIVTSNLNILCIFLYILSGVTYFTNIYCLFKMFYIDKKFSFEKYVLISGIIEVSFILLFIITIHKEFILDIIQALQILITLYISKQFLKLYIIFEHSMKGKQETESNGKHIYNAYFWILAIISFLLVVASIITDISDIFKDDSIFKKIKENADYIIDLLNDFIFFIISVILFIFSIMVRKILTLKSQENAKSISKDENDDNDDNDYIYNRNEIYLSTRKIQIFIISFGNLVTDFVELIISIFKEAVFRKEDKDIKEDNINIFDILTLYSLWTSTFLNYIAFYFVVRNSFHINYVHISRKKSSIVLETHLIGKEEKNNDIDNFIDDKNTKKDFKPDTDNENF